MQDAPDRGVLGFLMHIVDEYLSENDGQVKIPLICFGRDSINYHADLLSDDLARNTFPSPWALTIRPKIPERISGNFHGQMVQSFSSVEDDNCSLGVCQ